MSSMNAAAGALEVLAGHGISAVFGNPGTTELALLDGFTQGSVRFHLGLNEAVATAMADGYARASNGVGVILVHTAVGLANTTMGLINAQADQTPLVVLVGDKDDALTGRGHFVEVADVTGLARQLCKAAWRITRPEKLPELLQRALKIAKTPPCGPVVITVPQNYFDSELPHDAQQLLARYSCPAKPLELSCAASGVSRVIEALRSAKRPLLISGNEVGKSGRLKTIVQLAEKVGAAVMTEQGFTNNRLNFPTTHPLHHGPFDAQADVVKESDLILAVGAKLFMEYDLARTSPFPEKVELIQVGSDPGELNKIYAADLAILTDVASFLDEAARQVAELPEQSAGYQASTGGHRFDQDHLSRQAGHLTVEGAISLLSKKMPQNAVIVDESVGSKAAVQRSLELSVNHEYFSTCSGGLGWGVGAAVGVQLAHREKQVFAILGDGATLFTSQGMWSAAPLQAPVIYIILNNAGYGEVKRGLTRQAGQALEMNSFPGAAVNGPAVEFTDVARGFGVTGEVCHSPEELDRALDRALAAQNPYLIDVRLSDAV